MSKPTIENKGLLALDVIESAGLDQATTGLLKDKFSPFLEKAQEWRERAEGLVVTDESQTREMKMARQARLALRQILIDADKTRKELKEDALKYGRAVQGVYNTIKSLIEPIEAHLLEQEKFAEIQERFNAIIAQAKRDKKDHDEEQARREAERKAQEKADKGVSDEYFIQQPELWQDIHLITFDIAMTDAIVSLLITKYELDH